MASGDAEQHPTETTRRLEERLAGMEEWSRFSGVLEGFLGPAHAAGPAGLRLRLVIEELAANAFHHGGASATGGVHIALVVETGGIAGEVSYRGPAFDPTGPPPPSCNDREGGHGLRLVQGVCAALTHTREGEVNRTRFRVTAD